MHIKRTSAGLTDRGYPLLQLCTRIIPLILALLTCSFAYAEQSDLYMDLSALPEVTSIDMIIQDTDVFSEKYILYFSQPVDHCDPEDAHFEQRVEIGIRDRSAFNVVNINGYMLHDDAFPADDRCEPAVLLDANSINIEYRFFGVSVPEGLSDSSTDLWKYLTNENAAADFHRIITALSKILPGKWIITGTSKGGQAVLSQACLYGDDGAAFISYTAPICSARSSSGFFRNIYTSIGDTAYDPDSAKAYRDLVLEFQLTALRMRDSLQKRYYELGVSRGARYREYCTAEILYDIGVLEFATQAWQYNRDFRSIDAVLHSGDAEDPETVFALLVEKSPPETWSYTDPYFPYYVQCALQNGEHDYDFSFLRAALESDPSGAYISVQPEDEAELLYRCLFTEEQYELFRYDPAHRDRILEWSRCADSPVMLIYGAADPWYTLHLPEPENESIHIYTIAECSHICGIIYLPIEECADVMLQLKRWLA